MIGLLVRYRSDRSTSRAGQLGIVVALGTAKVGVSVSHGTATVRWLEDGATLTYLVRELEVVRGNSEMEKTA